MLRSPLRWRYGALLVVPLLAGCLDDRSTNPIGFERGTFQLNIPALDGSNLITGNATYGVGEDLGRPSLSITFQSSDRKYFMELTNDKGLQGEEGAEIGTEPGMLAGTLEVLTGDDPILYTLISGSASWALGSPGIRDGTIQFQAIQTDGPEPGKMIIGTGTFSASCSAGESCSGAPT